MRYSGYIFFIAIIISGCSTDSFMYEREFDLNPVQIGKKFIAVDEASHTYKIDLDTAIRLTADNNLEISAAREMLHEAYAKALIADNKLYPVIGPSVQFSRLEGETQGTAGEFVDVDKQNYTAALRAGIRLPLGDAIFSKLSAKKIYRASESSYAAVKKEKLMETAVAYLEMLKWDQLGEILESTVKISETLVNELDESVKIGNTFRGELLRAQTQLVHNKLELVKAKGNLKEASMRLVRLLNLDYSVELAPAEQVVVPLELVKQDNIDRFISTALNNRAELQSAVKELEAFENEQSSSKWGALIPDVIAESSFGEFGPVPADLDGQNIYFVGIGWRIGSGGLLDHGRMHLANARVKQAQINLAKTQQKIKNEVKLYYESLNLYQEQMKLAGDQLRYAEESLKLSRERQRAGSAIPLEVIHAEESLTRAQSDALVSIIGYNQTQFRLLWSLGETLQKN